MTEAVGEEIAIRAAFRASDPSRALLSLDYSQIEMRILGHVCGDPVLRSVFHEDDGGVVLDIYTKMACRVFHVTPETVRLGNRGSTASPDHSSAPSDAATRHPDRLPITLVWVLSNRYISI